MKKIKLTQGKSAVVDELKPASSKYKGVSFHKLSEKWGSYIRCDGRQKWLGVFDSETEAAFAYDDAAQKLFGEYALLNFPKKISRNRLR